MRYRAGRSCEDGRWWIAISEGSRSVVMRAPSLFLALRFAPMLRRLMLFDPEHPRWKEQR